MPIDPFGREGKLGRRGVLTMKLALILAVFLASFALVETSRAQSSSSTSSTGTVKAIAIAGATYAVQTAPPVIFNVSSNVQAGDIISIQGTNFDTTSQIWLGGPRGNSATKLAVVNKVGVEWMAAQTPQAWSGAMILWISNSSGVSNSVALNPAKPWDLDA